MADDNNQTANAKAAKDKPVKVKNMSKQRLSICGVDIDAESEAEVPKYAENGVLKRWIEKKIISVS
ncbi:hypothetical protein [uncultured Paraglaciecola sp.]|uniref:hypothetical protein n=1 Tax=uncultured Paraglaciecola sp. TaxID=1765024 RepID=UPI002605E021|nr:hypothetical protein [uncultured Paraglaciecola sp.]